MKFLVLLTLCAGLSACQSFIFKAGVYYQDPKGDQIGASVELDPTFAKQKK